MIEFYFICDYIECMLVVFGWLIEFLFGCVCLSGGYVLCVIEVWVLVDFFLVVFFLVVGSIVFGVELCLLVVGFNFWCIGLL